MIRRTHMSQLQWALTYRLPSLLFPVIEDFPYLYSTPFTSTLPANLGKVVQQGPFVASDQSLPLEQILLCRLIPASPIARVQCALAAFQEQQGGPMILGALDRDKGTYMTWYAPSQLWGATGFSLRTGKEGTVFAHSLETLVARELAHEMFPRPDLASKWDQQAFGVQSITPGRLPFTTETPLAEDLRQLSVQAFAEAVPHFATPGQLPEWLVSVLYEERLMVVTHPSFAFPSLEAVIWRLLVLRQMTASCQNEQAWDSAWGEEQDPYEVCLRRLHEFEGLLGTWALPAVEQAFLQTLLEQQLPPSRDKEEQSR